MGVHGLWETLKPACEPMEPLLEYALKEGFQRKYHHGRKLNLGVDASLYLASIKAAQLWRTNIHLSSDPLQTLFHQLCRYIRTPINLIYVFDGANRPALKQNTRVINRQVLFHEKAKTLIRAFGFHVYDTTYADAEAELVNLAHNGTVDGIITEDGDAVVFGAPQIFRINRNSTGTRVFLDVYSAEKIEKDLGLSHAGLILFALLVGGDYHDGVEGCGPATAHAMARCGFGESLIRALDDFLGLPEQHLADFLISWKDALADEMTHNHQGHLERKNPKAATSIREDASFPSLDIVHAYRRPQTNRSTGSPLPDTSLWIPSEPNLAVITDICISTLEWTNEYLLKQFQETLWHGIALQMLYSTYLVYDLRARKLATPYVNAVICRPTDAHIHKTDKSEIRVTLSIPSFFSHFKSDVLEKHGIRDKKIIVTVPQPVLSVAVAKSEKEFNGIISMFNMIPRSQAHAIPQEDMDVENTPDSTSDMDIEFGELTVRNNFIDLTGDCD
ncbi:hypothetical protein VKT23_006355 [Stygiomarasmius scandens]|uniref:XPG-I domain-containing protein n=1 Tax=Marasmiellus scandens TaxID=2682957 RepID=A0ABR1JQU7_9AGAR